MNNRDLAPQIVQHCITPRALLSPMDADFCSFFIKTLHLTATPGFHTLGILDGVRIPCIIILDHAHFR